MVAILAYLESYSVAYKFAAQLNYVVDASQVHSQGNKGAPVHASGTQFEALSALSLVVRAGADCPGCRQHPE